MRTGQIAALHGEFNELREEVRQLMKKVDDWMLLLARPTFQPLPQPYPHNPNAPYGGYLPPQWQPDVVTAPAVANTPYSVPPDWRIGVQQKPNPELNGFHQE